MNTIPKHIARGAERRLQVLEGAVQVATVEGLDALTISRVAEMNGFTKAGLLGHFNSKEELQIATLKAGRDAFFRTVVEPARNDAPGMVRTALLLDRWVSQVARTQGGCFFASVAAEFDSREGPVRDAIAAMVQEWVGGLEFFLGEAHALRHLKPQTDVEALAFQLHGYEMSFNLRLQLLRDHKVEAVARKAMHDLLLACATASGKTLLHAALSSAAGDTTP